MRFFCRAEFQIVKKGEWRTLIIVNFHFEIAINRCSISNNPKLLLIQIC